MTPLLLRWSSSSVGCGWSSLIVVVVGGGGGWRCVAVEAVVEEEGGDGLGVLDLAGLDHVDGFVQGGFEDFEVLVLFEGLSDPGQIVCGKGVEFLGQDAGGAEEGGERLEACG